MRAIKIMQAFYPENFDREMGCTGAEWLGWLPGAVGDCPWTLHTSSAQVWIGDGSLCLSWHAAPARVIGLISIPVLKVSFRFAGLGEPQRHTFMKRFDLYMQRGGG